MLSLSEDNKFYAISEFIVTEWMSSFAKVMPKVVINREIEQKLQVFTTNVHFNNRKEKCRTFI